jgi:hypothetical protein
VFVIAATRLVLLSTATECNIMLHACGVFTTALPTVLQKTAVIAVAVRTGELSSISKRCYKPTRKADVILAAFVMMLRTAC